MAVLNYIYLITNTQNNKKYIYPARAEEDLLNSPNMLNEISGLELLIDDYGEEAFSCELLQTLDTEGFGEAINKYAEEYSAKIL